MANNRVMPKPNLHFVSRMAFGHFMRFTTLPVCLGIHGRYTKTGNIKMSFDSEEKMYEMLGRYITGFEDFCRSIQDRIIDVLTIQGLRNSDVHEIILEGLTAAPLLSKLQALVNSVV